MRFFFTLAFIFGLGINTGLATTNFSDQGDIPEWAEIPISVLVQEEVLKGNSDGSFQPERNLNRAEFCKILVKATKTKKFVPQASSFPDVESSDWFFSYVETAKHHGWLKGYPDGTFRPGNSINRAEAAKILGNAFGFEASEAQEGEQWYETYFHTLNENKLLAYGTEFHTLDPEKNPTRAEISEQIFRAMKKVGKISALDFPEIQATESTLPQAGTTPPSFEYYAPATEATVEIDDSAGSLYIEKSASLTKDTSVSKGDSDVTAQKLQLISKEGLSEVSSFQFRRIGNGTYSDFSKIWIEANGSAITNKITPTADLVRLPLKQALTAGSSVKEITVKVDIASSAKSGSSRWVLFLPEWIEANTETKIGFFPIGGCDLEIE
jgi:hypothetical protein